MERLWRSIKYEEVYPEMLLPDQSPEARTGINAYLEFYNACQRPHSGFEATGPQQRCSTTAWPGRKVRAAAEEAGLLPSGFGDLPSAGVGDSLNLASCISLNNGSPP